MEMVKSFPQPEGLLHCQSFRLRKGLIWVPKQKRAFLPNSLSPCLLARKKLYSLGRLAKVGIDVNIE